MSSPRSRRRPAEPEAVSSTRLVSMAWSHRLFLHWPVDPDAVRERVPSQLTIDTANGQAWLGISAYKLSGVRAVLAPPMPGLSSFNEVTARIGVTYRDEPGVFFFSLDASSSVAVWTARTFLHLPYFRARIQATRRTESFRFVSRRTHQGAQPAAFDCAWNTGRALATARPGSLPHFLTERRLLFTVHRGRVFACHVEHEPWPLREARVTKLETNLFAAAGVPPPDGAPLAYHCDQMAVEMCSVRDEDPLAVAAGLFDPAVSPPPASLARY